MTNNTQTRRPLTLALYYSQDVFDYPTEEEIKADEEAKKLSEPVVEVSENAPLPHRT